MAISYLKSLPLLLDLALDLPEDPKPKSPKSPKTSSNISEKEDEKSKLPKPPDHHLEKQRVQIGHNWLFSFVI